MISRRLLARAKATEFLSELEAKVRCAHCGRQSIEWHNASHVEKPNARVSSLRSQGASIERILVEIERCVPLCRSCHMIEDGRMAMLRSAQPNQLGRISVPIRNVSSAERKLSQLDVVDATGATINLWASGNLLEQHNMETSRVED